jgi:hypothetical protein
LSSSKQVTTFDTATFVPPSTPKNVRFEFTIRDHSYSSQFARYMLQFGKDPKTYVITVLPTDNATTVAQKLEAAINYESLRYEGAWLQATRVGTVLTFTLSDKFHDHPEELSYTVKVQDEDGMFEVATSVWTAPVFTYTPAVAGTNTAKFLRENLRLLTEASTRPYEHVYNNQLPVDGALYSNLYLEFQYTRSNVSGISIANQIATGLSRMDIYVLESNAPAGAIAANSVISVIATFLNSAPGTKKFIGDAGTVVGDLATFLG